MKKLFKADKRSDFSEEHISYLKSKKRSYFTVQFFRAFILIAFIALWEICAETGLIDAFIFSSPSRMLKSLAELYEAGELFTHTLATLCETLIGFTISLVLGYLIAVALWWNESVRKIFEPYLVVFNSLPKIALGPLIIVWFGTGEKSIIFMTVIIGIIIVIMNMLSGFTATEKGKLMLLRSLGASKWQILTRLVIPSSLPTLFSTLKISVGMAWIGSIMGEYLISRRGLGYLIVYGGQVFRLDLVMASTLLLCMLAGLMYLTVSLLEKLFVRK